MWVSIGIVVTVALTVGIFIGRKVGLKRAGINFFNMQEDIDGLIASKGFLVNQLKKCRERSSIRKDEIESLTESLSACKNEKQQMRKELYAYRKKYGELN